MGERRVAAEDTYAYDHLGLRRQIKAGFELPPGWKWEDEPESKPEPKKLTVAKAKKAK